MTFYLVVRELKKDGMKIINMMIIADLEWSLGNFLFLLIKNS